MQRQSAKWLHLAPAGLWFSLIPGLPLCFVAVLAIGSRAAQGSHPALTQVDSIPATWAVLTLPLLGTILSLLIAYPLAYFLALQASPKWRVVLLIFTIAPFLAIVLIRSYAWSVFPGGLPALLVGLGLAGFSPFAVLMGIVYAYLPLMVLPIFFSLNRLDQRLMEASADLGAPPFRSVLHFTLPQSRPGIATGCTLVFLVLAGEYLIPVLLGGKLPLISTALVAQSRTWAFAAAVSAALTAIPLVIALAVLSQMRPRSGARHDASP